MALGRSVDVEEERGHPGLRVFFVVAFLLALAVAGLVLTAGIWLKHKMQSSLPELDGRQLAPGLTAPVVVRRDQRLSDDTEPEPTALDAPPGRATLKE